MEQNSRQEMIGASNMKPMRINLWEESEYHYPLAAGFLPNLRCYLHNDEEIRPAMIIVPGGGYQMVSPSEAWLVGEEFFYKGYQIFVLTYTTDPLMQVPLKDQPMKDLSRAIRRIRQQAKEWRVSEHRIYVCGFSAGGHLAGSVAVHFQDIKEQSPELRKYSNRPDAVILNYAVICSGEYRHEGSIQSLLGKDLNKVSLTELEYYSIEKHVNKNTPPCFLWHTASDASVSPENSIRMADACKKAGIRYALHIFSKGQHGLSLANRKWAELVEYDTYTFEQVLKVIGAAQKGEISLPQETIDELLRVYGAKGEKYFKHSARTEVPEVAIWPVLVDNWLRGSDGESRLG